jgi:hypothetical protein
VCSTLQYGGVALCPIYDPADPVPTDRYQLMNAQNCVRGPVYQPLSVALPGSALRKNDTMYVREFHSELVDPAEQRTTDLGYIACVLTDTDPTADASLNFGDLFVEYTIDLFSPRVGSAAAKVCHISSSNHSHTFGGTFPPLFPADRYSADGTERDLISDHSTLMVDMEHHNGEAYHLENSTYPIEYSAITFKEPFSGTMTVVSNNKGGSTAECTVMCNGIRLQDEFSDRNTWDLQPGAVHPHRFAKVKPLRSIKNRLDSAVHIVKVVAQAGETLAMAMATGATYAEHYAEIILTEAGPLLLDAMELLVL